MTDDHAPALTRRQLLAVSATTTALTAGCFGDEDNGDTTGGDDGSTDTNANGDANGDANGTANGTDNGGENGTANGTDNGGENGTDDPTPTGRLTSLSVTGQTPPAAVDPDRGLITTATVANDGAAGDIPVRARLEDDTGTAVETATTTVTLDAGATTTRSLTGSSDSALLGRAIRAAPPGTYQLVASIDADTDTDTGADTDTDTDTTSDATTRSIQVRVRTPATPTLETPTVATTPVTTATSGLTPRSTLSNTGDLDGAFAVQATLTPTDSDEGVAHQSQTTDTLEADEETSLALPLSAPESGFDAGTYTLTVTATATDDSDRQARQTRALPVEQAPGQLDITVYTQAASDEYTARAGTLRVTDRFGETVATRDLGESASVTINEGVEHDAEYTIATENVDEGVYPDGEETVTVDGITEVDLVTAYEFQGAESFRMSVHAYDPNSKSDPGIDTSQVYTGWATHAANADHYATWLAQANRSSLDVDSPIHPHGADLRQFSVSGTVFVPAQNIKIGEEAYARLVWPDQTNDWDVSSAEDIAYYPRDDTAPAHAEYLRPYTPLTEQTDADPDRQQFTGETTYKGKTVHTYEVTFETFGAATTVYVDPETGHVLRAQSQPADWGQRIDGFVILEFTDHGEIDSLSVSDFEFTGPQPPISEEPF